MALFKSKTPPTTFIFDNVEYRLNWDGKQDAELDIIAFAFMQYIDEEIELQSRMPDFTKPELMLVHQLSIIASRTIAVPHILAGVSRLFQDNEVSRSYVRFLDTIQYIQMTVHTEYLDMLKGRFLKSVFTIPTDSSGTIPATEEEWKLALSLYPWIYLLPFVAASARASTTMAKYKEAVRIDREHRTHTLNQL